MFTFLPFNPAKIHDSSTDDIFYLFFLFLEKIRLDILSELPAKQTIHIKYQA